MDNIIEYIGILSTISFSIILLAIFILYLFNNDKRGGI